MKKKLPAGKSGNTTKTPTKPARFNEVSLGFFDRNKYPLLLFLVIVITFILYLPALQNSFTNWDDNDYVTENPHIKTISNENIQYIFNNPIAVNYHPLTILSLTLNYKFSGLEPFSYYLVNLLLHLLNTLLTYFFVLLLFDRNKTAALFAAAIFAVHPMHVESVAWIAERKDVLYTLFYLAGLIAYIYYNSQRKWYYLLFAFILYLFSALSKPSAVVFPLVLFLIDFLRSRKISVVMIVEKIPFFLISVWIGVATIKAQTGLAIADITNYSFLNKFLVVSYGFFTYIIKLVVPIGMSALHRYPIIDKTHYLPWVFYIIPVINILFISLALYSLKYTRIIMFGLLFYFLNILLTLQFVQVGNAIIAERYTYLSYTGLFIILIWIINRAILRKWLPGRMTPWLVILYLVILGSVSAQRVQVWKNSETLWNDVIEKDPEGSIGYNGRGNYYSDNGKTAKAIQDFTRSIELNTAYADPYFNRGNCYLDSVPGNAIGDYSKGLSMKPDYFRGYKYRADAYAALGKYDSAIADYSRAIELSPQYYAAYNNRSNAWAKKGNFDKVIEDCNKAIELSPKYTEAWFNLGQAFASKGDFKSAINSFDKACLYSQNNYAAIYNRGLANASIGDFASALKDLGLAISIKPNEPSTYLNRALLYLNTGKKQLACGDLDTAMKLGDNTAKQIYMKECSGKR